MHLNRKVSGQTAEIWMSPLDRPLRIHQGSNRGLLLLQVVVALSAFGWGVSAGPNGKGLGVKGPEANVPLSQLLDVQIGPSDLTFGSRGTPARYSAAMTISNRSVRSLQKVVMTNRAMKASAEGNPLVVQTFYQTHMLKPPLQQGQSRKVRLAIAVPDDLARQALTVNFQWDVSSAVFGPYPPVAKIKEHLMPVLVRGGSPYVPVREGVGALGGSVQGRTSISLPGKGLVTVSTAYRPASGALPAVNQSGRLWVSLRPLAAQAGMTVSGSNPFYLVTLPATAGTGLSPSLTPFTGVAEDVADGDTLIVRSGSRKIQVDLNETMVPEANATDATEFLRNLVRGQHVNIYPVKITPKGVAAWVLMGKISVNRQVKEHTDGASTSGTGASSPER